MQDTPPPSGSSAMQDPSETQTEPYKARGEAALEPATQPGSPSREDSTRGEAQQRAESTDRVTSPARQQDSAVAGLVPTIIVIFGITGDLSKRYLLPSLYHLFKENLLHEHTQIVGLTRQPITADELYEKVEHYISEVDTGSSPGAIEAIQAKTELLQFDPANAEDYPRLFEKLNAIEAAHGMCMNRLYYLSIPPQLFETTVTNLGAAGLNQSCPHGKAKTRILVEKPFGYDLPTAEKLIGHASTVFEEEQVYRIDHYLAKETVQNILTFRSQNPIFASIWSKQHVKSIEIAAYEKIGIEGRVHFYEGVGALRDFVQSHLLQLLTITTMELNDSDIHAAKQALLEAIGPADPARAVRGQYEGYKEEVGNPNSTTETYAQIHLSINTERWQGVPVTITTGKALAVRHTAIAVTFVDPADTPGVTNTLTFRIQPNEGIHLQLRVKKPGFTHEIAEAVMDFSYSNAFGVNSNHPGAYERVLLDAVKGDRTLFATSGEVLASWRIIQPLMEAWHNKAEGLKVYVPGSAGPDALALLE